MPASLVAGFSLACGSWAPTGEDVCGDGLRGPLEECDPSVLGDAPYCAASCTWTWCGDGDVQPPETCDPPDVSTCTTTCRVAGCGNGLAEVGEACFDEVAPTVLSVAGSLVAFDVHDLDRDGDLDLLLARGDGVDALLQTDGAAFTPYASVAVPETVAVLAVDGTRVPGLDVLTRGDPGTLWEFAPGGTGWESPAVTTLPGPGSRLVADGPLALIALTTGWGLLVDHEWRDLVNAPNAPVPAATTPADTGNPPSAIPDLWLVNAEQLVRLSFFNWVNVPGFAELTAPLPTGSEAIALASAVTREDEPPTVVGLLADGRLLRWVADDAERVNGTFDVVDGATGHALAAGPIDVGYDDVVVADEATLHVVFDPWSDAPPPVVDVPLIGTVDEVRLLDVDGDGHADLLVRDEAAGTLTIRWARP